MQLSRSFASRMRGGSSVHGTRSFQLKTANVHVGSCRGPKHLVSMTSASIHRACQGVIEEWMVLYVKSKRTRRPKSQHQVDETHAPLLTLYRCVAVDPTPVL
jgi:hypothetical protein